MMEEKSGWSKSPPPKEDCPNGWVAPPLRSSDASSEIRGSRQGRGTPNSLKSFDSRVCTLLAETLREH